MAALWIQNIEPEMGISTPGSLGWLCHPVVGDPEILRAFQVLRSHT